LPFSHLLLNARGGLEIRLKEPDVSAHHAEMGICFAQPKIHRLRADAKEHRRFAEQFNGIFICNGKADCPPRCSI